jgi:hypothetical protein
VNAIRAALDKLCGGCYNFKGSRCCKAAGEFCSHFDARAELAAKDKRETELTAEIESWRKVARKASDEVIRQNKSLEAADALADDYEGWHRDGGGTQAPLVVSAYRAARGNS